MSEYDANKASSDLDKYAREAGLDIQRYQNPLSDKVVANIEKNLHHDNTISMRSLAAQAGVTDPKKTTVAQRTRQKKVVGAPEVNVLDTKPKNTVLSPEVAPPQTQTASKSKNTSKSVRFSDDTTKNDIQKDSRSRTPSQSNTADDGEYTAEERAAKAAEFHQFIEKRLKPNLQISHQRLDAIAVTLHEYEQLLQSIDVLDIQYKANIKKGQSKIDIGCKFMADAQYLNKGTIVIELGLDIWAEMPYNDARIFIQDKCQLLTAKLAKYNDDCCMWSARIKGMTEAIGVLQDYAPDNIYNLGKQLRDVYYQ